jgi:hypothetical protein
MLELESGKEMATRVKNSFYFLFSINHAAQKLQLLEFDRSSFLCENRRLLF